MASDFSTFVLSFF